MTFSVRDSLGNWRAGSKIWVRDSLGNWRAVANGWVRDSAGNWRKFFDSAPPNVLAATMVAGTSTNFIGFSASPSSPTFGSCSPIMTIGNYRCCYMGSISINAELEISFTGLTDPGQAGLFTSWVDGLGGTRTAASAIYVWNNTSKIARWRYTTAGVDYVNGNSYSVSLNV